MWVAGYGPKALAVAGRVGDGVIIQLADPEIIQWIMGTARRPPRAAGRDPAALKCIVCAPSHVGPIEEGRRDTLFPAMVSNHVKDLIERYGTDGSVVPHALTDYVEARKFYDYDEHSRVGAKHGEFVTDETRDRFDPRQRRPDHDEAPRAFESIGVDHFSIYLMTHRQEETLGVRHAGDPAVHGGDRGDVREENIRAWRSVARGRGGGADLDGDAPGLGATRRAAAPQPGETVLEPGAGPGGHGVPCAPAPSAGRPARISDAAPEMIEVARRRAAELGLDDVAFAVEDAESLKFDDAPFDGVLWRWGPMLIPHINAVVSSSCAVSSVPAAGHPSPWASPSANEWMTASGRAALELGLVDPPDRDAPGPFRLAGDGLLREALERGGSPSGSTRTCR